MSVEGSPARASWICSNRNTLAGMLVAILILIAVVALYAPGINAPLVFDDVAFFDNNYASAYGASFDPLSSRFWPSASLAFQRIMFGEDLAQFRAVNVALHLLSGAALLLFLRTLYAIQLGRDSNQGITSSRMLGIWLSVFLFLVHPVAVYSVAYLVERSIVMATLFSLLMWWAHLRGLESGKPAWFIWSCLFCYLALFSKEHSVMAPVAAVMLTGLFQRQVWRRAPLLLAFLVYFGLAVLVTIQNKYVIATAYQPWLTQGLTEAKTGNLYLASVLTQTGLFFKYIFLWFVPVTAWMSIDISAPLADANSLLSWLPAFIFAAYCGTGLLLLKRQGRPGLLGFALLAPAVLFATELSTARVTESFVLYRSYLWAPPLFVIVPLLVERLGKRVLLIVGLLAGSALFFLAAERLQTFSSPIALWGDVIRLADARGDTILRDRAYCNRGMAYLDKRRFDLALDDFEKARRWNPAQPIVYIGLGLVGMHTGHLEQAKTSLDMALKLKPDWPQALFLRADILLRMGETAAADDGFRQACEAGLGLACYARQKARGVRDVFIPANPQTPGPSLPYGSK